MSQPQNVKHGMFSLHQQCWFMCRFTSLLSTIPAPPSDLKGLFASPQNSNLLLRWWQQQREASWTSRLVQTRESMSRIGLQGQWLEGHQKGAWTHWPLLKVWKSRPLSWRSIHSRPQRMHFACSFIFQQGIRLTADAVRGSLCSYKGQGQIRINNQIWYCPLRFRF